MSKQDIERYHAAAHAVQSGVAQDQYDDPSNGTPKHLRVGVNMAMCDHAALAMLLMEKGVITSDEYEKALADQAEAEKARYEKLLSARHGTKITLG